VSLEGIARTAGVGIGTLYRHFPTREALVESVYAAELDEVVAAADTFLVDGSPAEVALRGWMNRYAAFVQAKRGMAETLRAALASGTIPASRTRAAVRGVVGRFLDAGAASGTLRDDVDPDDVTASLVGIFLATAGATDTAQRDRMLDLLVDGLRAR
jgi:AcrR family transcriptional regulator